MGNCNSDQRQEKIEQQVPIDVVECVKHMKECFTMIEFENKVSKQAFFKSLCEEKFDNNYQNFLNHDEKELRSKFNKDSLFNVLGKLNALMMQYDQATLKSPETQRYKQYLYIVRNNIELILEEYSSLDEKQKLKYRSILVNYGVLAEQKKEFSNVLDIIQDGRREGNNDLVELLHEQLTLILSSDNYNYSQLKSLLHNTCVFVKDNKFSKVNFQEISPLIDNILNLGGAMDVYKEFLKKNQLYNEMKTKEIVFGILEDLEEHTYLVYMGPFAEYAITSRKFLCVFINSSYMHPETMDFNTLYIALCLVYELGHQMRYKEQLQNKNAEENDNSDLENQIFGGIIDFVKLQHDHWKATQFLQQMNSEGTDNDGKKVDLKEFFKDYLVNEEIIAQRGPKVGILHSPSSILPEITQKQPLNAQVQLNQEQDQDIKLKK